MAIVRIYHRHYRSAGASSAYQRNAASSLPYAHTQFVFGYYFYKFYIYAVWKGFMTLNPRADRNKRCCFDIIHKNDCMWVAH